MLLAAAGCDLNTVWLRTVLFVEIQTNEESRVKDHLNASAVDQAGIKWEVSGSTSVQKAVMI